MKYRSHHLSKSHTASEINGQNKIKTKNISSWNNTMFCLFFLKSDLSPYPLQTSIPLRGLSPKGERNWKRVFERAIELSVD